MTVSAGNRAVPIIVPWHVGDPPQPVPASPARLMDPCAMAACCPPELFLRLKASWDRARWRQAGAAPLPFCPDYVIGDHAWPHSGAEQRTAVLGSLHRVSPTLDIIYDPATSVRGAPAYHLYTRYRGGYRGSDLLVYEYSLQHDFGAPWPRGVPLVPTLDLIPRIAATLKRNMYRGSDADIHKQVMADKLKGTWSGQVAVARRDAALSQFTYTDIMRPMLQRKRVQAQVPGLKSSAGD
jgi:hypothetical protein